MFLVRIVIVALVCVSPTLSLAQTSGSFQAGKPLPAAQLNSALGGKQDFPIPSSAIPGVGGVTFSGPSALGSVLIGTGPAAAGWSLPASMGVPTGYINVMASAYGAKGNTLSYADGTITAGTNAFSSVSATFAVGDVGKSIVVDYAGMAGAPLVTTINGFTDAHHVTLAANASATVPYTFTWSCPPTTTQSGAGSYAPNDTVTFTGGAAITNTVCTVAYTQVVSVVVNAGGSAGATNTAATTGACPIQGTTGSGAQLFVASGQLTAGVLTSINSITLSGAYTTNPTSLTAEPVTAVNGCTGLTGATVTLTMGILAAQPTTAGVYSVYPTSPVSQGSTSGSGTGATFSPQSIVAGAFMYGTDDTAAWTAAINAAIAQRVTGGPQCLFAPEGSYFISSPLPPFYAGGGVPGCIVGSGRKKTWLMISPALSGDVLSWSEAWVVGNAGKGTSASGGLGGYTNQAQGPIIRDLTMVADRNSTNNQNAIVFYDRNDQIEVTSVDLWGFNGYCLASGLTKNTTRAYVRESNFNVIRASYCGNSTHPVILFDSSGSPADATNEIQISQIDIFAFFGHGFQIRSDGTPIRDIKIDKLRIEGIQFDPVTIAADNFVIGEATATSSVNSVSCYQCEMLSAYPGQSAIRLDANNSGNAPYFIDYKGSIAGGAPIGQGLTVNWGRDSQFYFIGMNTIGANVTLGANAGTIGVSAPANAHGAYTYSISGGSIFWYPLFIGNPGGAQGGSNTAYLTAFAPNNQINTGNTPGTNAVSLGGHGGNPYNVAAANGVTLGGIAASAGGQGGVVIGGDLNQTTGQWSFAGGGLRINDRGWYGARCHASGTLTDFQGDAQICDVVLRCQAAATNGSTCRATADNAAAGAANTINIPAAAAYGVQLDCVAISRATPGNNELWPAWTMLLQRPTNAASTTLGTNTTPTPLTNGTVTGSSIAATADTANGGLNVTFTSPSTNSALWDFTCHAAAHQVQ